MTESRLFDPDVKVIDKPYIIFTTKYGIDANTGAKLDAGIKNSLLYINAEPTLELATITIKREPIEVWLPCVLLRILETGEDKRVIRVIYDPHYVVAKPGDLDYIETLTAEATRRPNTYNPLYRQ